VRHILAALLAIASPIVATAHSVNLTWTASTDTGVAYNVYRATGTCPTGAPTGAILLNTSPIGAGALTYTDATVTPGQWCYYATSTLNGMESIPSNLVTARVLPAPPTGVTVTSIQ